MKKIHFDDLSKQKYWKVLIALSLIFILSSFFRPFELPNFKVYMYLNVCGFFILTIHSSRLFWYKNNVQWNEKGIVIRIKPFFGKSISFHEIKSIELVDNGLVLNTFQDREMRFILGEINTADRKKLFDLIKENANLN